MADRAEVQAAREKLIGELAHDPWRAHDYFFGHRHREKSAYAHREVINLMHGMGARENIQAFRGFGKSTLVEEAIIIQAVYRRFNNKLIVGSSYERACERLASIKREIEMNERLEALFGNLKSRKIWQEGKIVLTTGACIQVIGREQSLRGTKYLEWRPDSALVDDVEDKDEVRTPLGRQKTRDWFLKEFLPALDHPLTSKVDVIGTPMDPESLVVSLEKDGWPTHKFPIEYLDTEGNRKATWPGKFSLKIIDQMKLDYRHDMTGWAQEYMLQPVSDADRVFTGDMIRVEPRERSWQAVYAMVDPARTTNRQSDPTGWAVWSWIGARLHVWAAGAKKLMPDEIVDLIFTIAREYNPVWVGVEEDGLNEWLLQPLRQAQARLGYAIPIKAIRAPRGKHDFIRGLQPFFQAREVSFNAPLPELTDQLIGFPTGKIDAPNALAYALQMRPAAPIYEGVGTENLVGDLDPDPSRPMYLAANAQGTTTTAVLCQQIRGQLRIYADWVEEGHPSETVPRIHAEANLEGDATWRAKPRGHDWTEALKLPAYSPILRRLPVRWIVPPHHGDPWNNVGLEQGIRLLPATVSRGTSQDVGRNQLRAILAARDRIVVSERAAWTLRALAGGYTKALRKGGILAEHAEDNVYKVLMEGLESFAGLSAAIREDENDDAQPVAYNKYGMPYKSAMPQRH